ncbi:MAG: hydroxyacid dehydrogenase [Ilumatobacteraceae bacterium]
MKEHRVLVVQPLHPQAMAMLDARPDVMYTVLTDVSEANLLAQVADVDAITIRDAVLPASAVDAAHRLKVISRHGVGYDSIPMAMCTARGIPVTVVGTANTVSVAEQTMLLILAAARAAIELDAATRAGDFAVRTRVRGVELRGRRLLLVGYGRIGREVAHRALAFEMRVRIFDPFVTATLAAGIEVVEELDDGLRDADVVSLHVPLTAATRHLIGARELALLPRGAIIVNTGRGGLIDEAALLASVRSGHLHGAGLDTFETEPLPAHSPLLRERRIVLSPHSAALTEQALIAMGRTTIANALAGIDGTLDPDLVVNPQVL